MSEWKSEKTSRKGGRGRARGGHQENEAQQQSRSGFSPRVGGFNQASSGLHQQPMPSSVEHKALVVRPRTQDCSPTPTSAQLSSLQLQQQLKTFPVLANFYRIAVSDIVVQHYDVAISVVKRWQIKPQPQSTQPKQSKQKVSKSSEPAAVMEKGAVKVEKAVPAAAAADDDDQKADLFVKKFSSEVFAAFQKDHPGYFTNSSSSSSSLIYDGHKALYSVRLLPIPPEQEFLQKVPIAGQGEKTFKVKIKHVESIDLSQAAAYFRRQVSEIPERVFTVLEIIFRRVITDAGYTTYQRNQFRAFDFVRGFLCGVCQTEFGLALNVHLKATGIISKSYSRLDHLGRSLEEAMPLGEALLRRVNENIKNLAISVCHTHLSYKVARLSTETPETFQFDYKPKDDGSPVQKISNFEYFRLKYPKVKISPRLPMVLLTAKKGTHMPLDVCRLKDVHFLSTKLLKDQEVQARLLSFSTLEPKIYFNSANQIKVKHDFGLEAFSLAAVRLNAHQLGEPKVFGAKPSERFVQPKKEAINFVVLCFDPQVKRDQLDCFVFQLAAAGEAVGLKFSPALRRSTIIKEGEVRCADDVRAVCEKKLKGYRNASGGTNTSEIYNTVKHVFDQKLGLMSQGINSRHVISERGPPKGYFGNLLLKVNGKTSGISTAIAESTLNSITGLKPDSTMVVGVDVYHPGSTDEVQSSIAAAIGSYDKGFTRYSASIRVQKKENKDREMILQMEEMMGELLQQYKRQNGGRFPTAIFIFRDGVSEGQLEKLRTIELKQIEAAVSRVIGPTKTPTKLSLICVQKRHHCRFALTEERLIPSGKGQTRPTSNVPRGTVVDSMIVDPDNEEFYLASHESPQGTTKPTKYIKIRDDLHLTMPNLQKFCYLACHQCVRNRNSISIPTAIRYADLCAYRSGLHIKTMNATYAHIKEPAERERKIISDLNQVIKVDGRLQHTFYYC
ncbi:argonaute 1 [Tyrophagus putrescentiae]|nr:argonaute 1 [Tyrophagus putrescentiae]